MLGPVAAGSVGVAGFAAAAGFASVAGSVAGFAVLVAGSVVRRGLCCSCGFCVIQYEVAELELELVIVEFTTTDVAVKIGVDAATAQHAAAQHQVMH